MYFIIGISTCLFSRNRLDYHPLVLELLLKCLQAYRRNGSELLYTYLFEDYAKFRGFLHLVDKTQNQII